MEARLRLTCVHGFRYAVDRNTGSGENLQAYRHSIRALAEAWGHLREFILRHFEKSRCKINWHAANRRRDWGRKRDRDEASEKKNEKEREGERSRVKSPDSDFNRERRATK